SVGSAVDSKLQFRGIGISEVVAKNSGERFRISRRNGGMSAGIFRKWRSLQQRPPFGINMLIDHRFRTHGIMTKLLIPAMNECIELCDGRDGVCVNSSRQIETRFFCGNAYNSHPVTRW